MTAITSAPDRGTAARTSGSMRNRRTWSTVVWVVVMILMTAVVLYPLAWMFSASFKPTAEFGSNQSFFPDNPTIQNYFKVIEGVGESRCGATSSTRSSWLHCRWWAS